MTEVFGFPRMIQEECALANLHGDQLRLNVGAINIVRMLKQRISLVHPATTKLGLQSFTMTGQGMGLTQSSSL